MRKFFLLLILLVTAISCITRKIDATEEQKKEVQSVQLQKENEQFNSTFFESQKDYKLSSFGFGYNVSLKSEDTSKPAIITEFRNGKPFRSLEVINATYTENTAVKDSSINEKSKLLATKYNKLEYVVSNQNTQIKTMQKTIDKMKVEGGKLANNVKFFLFFLITVTGIYISERLGLFGYIKRKIKKQ